LIDIGQSYDQMLNLIFEKQHRSVGICWQLFSNRCSM